MEQQQRAGDWQTQPQQPASLAPHRSQLSAHTPTTGSRPFDASTPVHANSHGPADALMSAWSAGQLSGFNAQQPTLFNPAFGATPAMQSSDGPTAPWQQPLHPLPASNAIQSTEQALLSLLASAGSGGLSLEQQIATVQAMLAAEEAKQAEDLRRKIEMQIQALQPTLPQQLQQPQQVEQAETSVQPKKSRHAASYPVHPAAASTVEAVAVAVPPSSSHAFPPILDRPRSVASSSNSDGSSETGSSDSSAPLVLPTAQSHSRRLLESMRELHILERWAEQYAAGELSEQAIAQFLSNNAANLEEAERSELLEAFDRMSVGARGERESTAASSGTPPRIAAPAAAPASPLSSSGRSRDSTSASSFFPLPAVTVTSPMWVNPQTAAEDDLDGVARVTFSFLMPTHAPTATAAAGATAAAAAGHKRKKSNEEASAASAANGTDASMQSAEAASSAAASSSPASNDSNAIVSPSSPTLSSMAPPLTAPARVLRVNKAWERLTGWTQVEAVEQTLRSGRTASMGLAQFLYRPDFVPAILRIGLVCQVEKVNAGQHYLVIRTKDGRDVHVIAGFRVLFQEDGTFLGVIHSYQPLPEGQMPPFVPGVDQTEAQLLWGAHATSSEFDWKAKLTGRD